MCDHNIPNEKEWFCLHSTWTSIFQRWLLLMKGNSLDVVSSPYYYCTKDYCGTIIYYFNRLLTSKRVMWTKNWKVWLTFLDSGFFFLDMSSIDDSARQRWKSFGEARWSKWEGNGSITLFWPLKGAGVGSLVEVAWDDGAWKGLIGGSGWWERWEGGVGVASKL